MLDAVGELLSRLTKTRATYLDAAISSRLSTAIKSVQYGTIIVYNGQTGGTAPITSVATDKAVLIHLGVTISSGHTASRISLTNSTTVSAVLGSNPGVDSFTNFVVVEFF